MDRFFVEKVDCFWVEMTSFWSGPSEDFTSSHRPWFGFRTNGGLNFRRGPCIYMGRSEIMSRRGRWTTVRRGLIEITFIRVHILSKNFIQRPDNKLLAILWIHGGINTFKPNLAKVQSRGQIINTIFSFIGSQAGTKCFLTPNQIGTGIHGQEP